MCNQLPLEPLHWRSWSAEQRNRPIERERGANLPKWQFLSHARAQWPSTRGWSSSVTMTARAASSCTTPIAGHRGRHANMREIEVDAISARAQSAASTLTASGRRSSLAPVWKLVTGVHLWYVSRLQGSTALRKGRDQDLLGEMLFGTVPMALEQSATKIHEMRDPSKTCFSRVFPLPIHAHSCPFPDPPNEADEEAVKPKATSSVSQGALPSSSIRFADAAFAGPSSRYQEIVALPTLLSQRHRRLIRSQSSNLARIVHAAKAPSAKAPICGPQSKAPIYAFCVLFDTDTDPLLQVLGWISRLSSVQSTLLPRRRFCSRTFRLLSTGFVSLRMS